MMAREGAKVVVNDIGASLGGEGTDQTPAGEVVAEIRKNGGEAVASYNSVAEWDSAHRAVQTAVDTFGRIDCVVNNAGILRDIIFHKLTYAARAGRRRASRSTRFPRSRHSSIRSSATRTSSAGICFEVESGDHHLRAGNERAQRCNFKVSRSSCPLRAS